MKFSNRQELDEQRAIYQQRLKRQKKKIYVCAGTGCVAGGSLEIFKKLKEIMEARGIDCEVALKHEREGECHGLKKSGCHGFCEKGPLLRIEPEKFLYLKATLADCEEIVERSILKDEVIERLVYEKDGMLYPVQENVPFYKSQKRLAFMDCGQIDAESIEEYIAYGGYSALQKCLFDMNGDEVIKVIMDSGLRGRGGGGFPAGLKWNFVKAQNNPEKYVICNGDEGDPGAFMDRSMMEGDPHRMLEGMMIAAYAEGATEGFIYVRAEYPLAIDRLQTAIDEARRVGILGKNILGTDFSFDIQIRYGAGAFVCGEETSLIHSIEGERGEPTNKPPFPAISGLWGKPTSVNNVETYANVSMILQNGADWYKSFGTKSSSGTKAFALTGNIENTGLIEVPMGITLRQIIFDIGGGIKNGKAFKAVQIGGPSGGCLTEAHLDLPLDFESLKEVGAMIGSGGLVVMDEDTCMVEVAKFFMNFTQNESCGKCVPCRIGNKRLQEILEKITSGKGTMKDLEKLKELGESIKDTSLCGLGQTSPNPILSTLKYFYHEYVEHVKDKKCRTGSCTALLNYNIIPEKCVGCTLCAKKCPVGCIEGKVKQAHRILQEKCIKCGACMAACKFQAIEKV